MDDSKFRKSKNVEVRKPGKTPPPGTPMGKFPSQPWLDDGAKVDGGQMATDLGRDDLAGAAGRAKITALKGDPTPSSFDDRFEAANDQGSGADKGPVGTAAKLMSSPGGSVQQAIIQSARAAGENPAYALAVAQRESNFNPAARSSKTIAGIYQMRGDLRSKYGAGDSADPGDQANGWMRSLPDIRNDMRGILGRDPTDQEAYLGHHYGARRAARTLTMDPSTPTGSIFTPQEMGANPHFARAGTIGNLNESVMGDIGKRMARFGGDASAATEPADLSSFGEPVLEASSERASSMPQASSEQAPDLSSFGQLVSLEQPSTAPEPNMAIEERKYSAPEPAAPAPQPAAPAAPSAPDLSQFGTAA